MKNKNVIIIVVIVIIIILIISGFFLWKSMNNQSDYRQGINPGGPNIPANTGNSPDAVQNNNDANTVNDAASSISTDELNDSSLDDLGQ